ncbi:hypothetical protein D3C87_1252990 [compost metagenome]
MIETDRPNGVEVTQVIFVRNVVAVPSDHIKGRVIQFGLPKTPLKFLHQTSWCLPLLEPGIRRKEVTRVG